MARQAGGRCFDNRAVLSATLWLRRLGAAGLAVGQSGERFLQSVSRALPAARCSTGCSPRSSRIGSRGESCLAVFWIHAGCPRRIMHDDPYEFLEPGAGRWHNRLRMTTVKGSQTPLASTPGLLFHGISFDPTKHTVRTFDLAGFDAELQDPVVFSWVDIQAPNIKPLNEVLRRMD